MVDQDRMKEYIAMGMSIDDSLKLCQEEDAQAKKEAAKEAKIAQKDKKDADAPNNNETDASNTDEDDTQFIKKDEVSNIVKDTIKSLKDDEEFKNFLTGNNDEPAPERTVNSVVEAAVQKMRTGK